MKKIRALVCGAGGFIGGHLVNRLKDEGYWVIGVDLKRHEYMKLPTDEFVLGDLTNLNICKKVFKYKIDEIYQLAADMGGAGYIFTGENDANIMHNSSLINLNIAKLAVENKVQKLFYSSSACIYPQQIQTKTNIKGLKESFAYPANPDSEYGWEKIFSERMYLSFMRNFGLSVRIARFHNIFGPFGSWNNGKEKAPAAMCRKVAMAGNNDVIEVWGDGKQTRSFLYIDECLEGVRRLMKSEFTGPVNIGSDEQISINNLVKMVAEIANKKIKIKHIPGPLGVRGRNSENTLIKKKLRWSPSRPLYEGVKKTYQWISDQLK